eukprot:354231-Chlamydomonas_euryale.AAC.2
MKAHPPICPSVRTSAGQTVRPLPLAKSCGSNDASCKRSQAFEGGGFGLVTGRLQIERAFRREMNGMDERNRALIDNYMAARDRSGLVARAEFCASHLQPLAGTLHARDECVAFRFNYRTGRCTSRPSSQEGSVNRVATTGARRGVP